MMIQGGAAILTAAIERAWHVQDSQDLNVVLAFR